MSNRNFGSGESTPSEYHRPWYNKDSSRVILVGALGLLILSVIRGGDTSASAPSTVVSAGNDCVADLSHHRPYTLNREEYSATTGEVDMKRLDTDLAQTIPGESNCVNGQFITLIRDFNQFDLSGRSGLNIYYGPPSSDNNRAVINVPTSIG
jgi:hypothetical protein